MIQTYWGFKVTKDRLTLNLLRQLTLNASAFTSNLKVALIFFSKKLSTPFQSYIALTNSHLLFVFSYMTNK